MSVKMLAVIVIIAGLLLAFGLLPTPMQNETNLGEAAFPQLAVVQPEETEDVVPAETEAITSIKMIERSLSLESTDPDYEINGAWPYLSGDPEAVTNFNQEMERKVQAAQDSFLVSVDQREEQNMGQTMPALSFLEMDYDVTHDSAPLVSVYFMVNYYVAVSAHPFYYSDSLNYDVQRGETLTIRDLFLPNSDYHQVIVDLVAVELASREGLRYQEGVVEEVLQRRENWNIVLEGLRINFDPYEVAPGAAGPQQVLIEWGAIADLLDLDGQAGFVIDN